MAINFEVKGMLAKLLAAENLIIEHQKVQTPSFDVTRRVLTLPLWDKASHDVYDLLVSHEVGHALYTPDEDWGDTPFQFVNVVEDVRIEKLIKRKFPGLSKTFYKGYGELHEKDFFEIDGEDVDKLNLADRINLDAKIGNFVKISFKNKIEEDIYGVIKECKTFDDVIFASKLLYKYCVDQLEKKVESKVIEPDTDDGKDFSEEFFDDGKSESEKTKEVDVETTESFESNIKDLSDTENSHFQNVYAEVPKVNLEQVIVPNDKVTADLIFEFLKWKEELSETDGQYLKIKRSAQKEVNYMVKEFECKKAADAHSRTSLAKTGVLDTTKLHNYKFSEDLFRKISIVPDGKSHGLIFILDWSGSMGVVLEDTVKQLFNLIWFCKKVQIPFDVYAFSSAHSICEEFPTKREVNTLEVPKDFKLIHFLTSDVKKNQIEVQMLNLWRLTCYLSMMRIPSYGIPVQYRLSGTPLNEALVTLHQIIPEFKNKTGVQKVQCVILTDGEANPLGCWVKRESPKFDSDDVRVRALFAGSSFLRNKKTGHIYPLPYYFYQYTKVLLTDLRETFPDVNFIGIRIVESRDLAKFFHRYEKGVDKKVKEARKEKSYALKNSGYDTYFAILSSFLSNDTEFDVKTDAPKSKIKTAFTKSLKSKALNRKVLSEFMNLVC